MQALSNVVTTVFWGLVTFSILVFVHEGGHFLAARACGVRVTEFFLGMPCRFNLHHVSKRIGTKFGITPILLGGYAAICGMDPTKSACAPAVLGYVHRHGRAGVDEMAKGLSASEDDVLEACVLLMGWGSIAPVYDREKGEGPYGKYYPSAYASVPRDKEGDTLLDGKLFDRAGATAEGDAWEPPAGDEAFFEHEKSRTYLGKGFWKRALMLLAGIGVNIATGLLAFVLVYSCIGVKTGVNINRLGTVEEGSPAAQAGLAAGDRVLSVDGDECSTLVDITDALDGAKAGQDVDLVLWTPVDGTASREADEGSHMEDSAWLADNGTSRDVTVTLDGDGKLGIEASTETVRLNPLQSAGMAWGAISQTAQMVGGLLIPTRTMDVLSNSTSVVGISVMSSQAVAAGPSAYLNFLALISFSLAFMNLLPLPPLDGGKLLIEVIQAVSRREVPLKVQNVISMAVLVAFLALFVYMLRADILRFFF